MPRSSKAESRQVNKVKERQAVIIPEAQIKM
jgi:hypothetical protein